MTRLSSAVVIATYGRPHVLKNSLTRWEQSERAPDQFIVVDASPDAVASRNQLVGDHPGLFNQSGSHYVVVDDPSAARQRNRALDLVDTDVVVFVDDDTLPEPDYLAKVVEVFEADTEGRIGGVEGTDPKFTTTRARVRLAVRDLMRLYARRISVPRRLAYPPAVTVPSSTSHLPLRRRHCLHGAKMSYRADLAKRLRFDPLMDRYSYCEDFDLSFRVGRTHALVARRDALVRHDRALVARPTGPQYYLVSWVNPAYLTEKLFPGPDSRRPFDRLLALERLKAATAVSGRLEDGRPGEPGLHRLVQAMVGYLRDGSGPLGDRFASLQRLIFPGGDGPADLEAARVWLEEERGTAGARRGGDAPADPEPAGGGRH